MPEKHIIFLEDLNRATDFEFRRNMSTNVSQRTTRIRRTLHCFREVINKKSEKTHYELKLRIMG